MSLTGRGSPVLHVIVCGSPLARDIGEVLRSAVSNGWDVWTVATPHGVRFFDVDEAERITGHPVHSRYRRPEDPPDLPLADAVVAVPATFNTVNKWVAGVSDTLALGVLTEALGMGLPIVAVPYSNRAHAAHPALAASVDRLREWGVVVLYGDDFYRLHEPRAGAAGSGGFPWGRVRSAIEDMRRRDLLTRRRAVCGGKQAR
ncbi:MAG: flavoprotein [Stackebrandtia sp.]